jgi:hypothetical protein
VEGEHCELKGWRQEGELAACGVVDPDTPEREQRESDDHHGGEQRMGAEHLAAPFFNLCSISPDRQGGRMRAASPFVASTTILFRTRRLA